MISAETGLLLGRPTTIVNHSINVHKDISNERHNNDKDDQVYFVPLLICHEFAGNNGFWQIRNSSFNSSII